MSDIFGHLLSWLIQFVLFVPFQILRLAGLLFPSCSSLGIVQLSQSVIDNLVQLIRFLWPVIKYIPWTFLWNILSAFLLYLFFKWLWKLWPRIASLGFTFWIVFTIFYGLGYVISFFTGDWADSPVFTEVFGESPSSTSGWSGGGFGGGGGGGW